MTVTNDLMFEVLKSMQGDLARVKADVSDIKETQLRLREDVHHLRADVLRFERIDVETQVRLDRIDKHLELMRH